MWSSELERTRVHVSEYTPDHVVTIDHQHHLIILTILGTRVFPSPQPMDIMMDLMATSKPFLHGKVSIQGVQKIMTISMSYNVITVLTKYIDQISGPRRIGMGS